MRKRIILLPMAIALGLSIAGCAKHAAGDNISADNVVPADESVTDNYGTADTAVDDGNSPAFPDDNALDDTNAGLASNAAASGNGF